MIRPIMRDVLFLKKKAVPATKNDMSVVQDLLDTLKANEAGCVGMAANMIGVNKRIIAVNMGFANISMICMVMLMAMWHLRYCPRECRSFLIKMCF